MTDFWQMIFIFAQHLFIFSNFVVLFAFEAGSTRLRCATPWQARGHAVGSRFAPDPPDPCKPCA